MKGWFLLTILSVLILPNISLAQVEVNAPYALSSELNIEIIPTYPRPNENVYVNLTMYTADLDSADIAWYKDGKQVLIGTGLKQFVYRAGAAGVETEIEIRIRLKDGIIFSRKIVLIPAAVTMVWESDSYVPPFYKGKALHPRQGRLKIVAIPDFVKDGKSIAAKNLVYEWSNGVEVFQNQSGYGRNVLIMNGSLLGSTETIELLVTDPINNLVANSFMDIPTTDPEIVFYRNDPYYGYLFDTAVPSLVNLVTDEIQLIAAPYFITKENAANLEYSWRLNGQAAPELEGSRTVVFRRPEGEEGQSIIRLNVSNLNRILQFADRSLTIQFDD